MLGASRQTTAGRMARHHVGSGSVSPYRLARSAADFVLASASPDLVKPRRQDIVRAKRCNVLLPMPDGLDA